MIYMYDIYIYDIYIYIYMWGGGVKFKTMNTWDLPVLYSLGPSKTRSNFQSKQGSFGFQVYIYIHMDYDIYHYM